MIIQSNDFDQEKAFFKALKRHGDIFPDTNIELKVFEEYISQMNFSIPEKFSDALKILHDGRIESVSRFNTFFDNQIEENLAQAAREGASISIEVLKRMEKDREESEKAIDNERAK